MHVVCRLRWQERYGARDVVIGNNYLAQGEARTMNRITEMWLTYVEDQLDQGRLPTMEAVREKLDGFIRFNEWPLLDGRGRHSRPAADAHALAELKRYRAGQRDLLPPSEDCTP